MNIPPVIFLKVHTQNREELVDWFKKNGSSRWSVSGEGYAGKTRFYTVTVRGEEMAMMVKLAFHAEIIIPN